MNYKRFLGAVSAALLIVVVIFTLASGAWAQSKFKTLHRFVGTDQDGSGPYAGLIFDQAGNLYGTTYFAGIYSYGIVFQLTPNSDATWTESVLYHFTGFTDGGSPYASLILDQAGNLYGTTWGGGNLCYFGCGTVFKLTPNADGSWSESVLYSFCSLTNCRDGLNPTASLNFDQAGNLYGTTESGGAYGFGVVFKLTPNVDGSWKEKVLHRFTGDRDGRAPSASLIFDQAGNLYGTTYEGGNLSYCGGNGCGVVFQLTPNADGSWKEKVLHKFMGGRDGRGPLAGLIFDQAGNLYGTTYEGGNLSYCGGNGCGVVFQLTPNADGSWTEGVLHRFTGGKDGGESVAGVIFDAAGNLYGTATQSGAGGYGVVFKMTPQSTGGWGYRVLHSFWDTPGAYPYGGLIFDTAGNLYGTTRGDFISTNGSVFEITP